VPIEIEPRMTIADHRATTIWCTFHRSRWSFALWSVVYVGLAALAATFAVLLLIVRTSIVADAVGFVIETLVLARLLVVHLHRTPRRARMEFERSGPHHYRFSDDAIDVRSGESHARITWPAMSGYAAMRNFWLLTFPNGLYFVVPHASLDPNDLTRFERLLRTNLTVRKTLRG
jgi:hypothetical protein